MESHNKMAESTSESHNISKNIRVLGYSLTRIIVLYGQNEYLAITFGIKIRAVQLYCREVTIDEGKSGIVYGHYIYLSKRILQTDVCC